MLTAAYLRRTLRVLALVPIVAGAATILFGSGVIPDAGAPGASVESELRFYGAWWVGAGAFLLWISGAIERRGRELLAFGALMWLGALARIIGWAADGRPHGQLLVLLAIEIVLPPLLVGWQRRVALP